MKVWFAWRWCHCSSQLILNHLDVNTLQHQYKNERWRLCDIVVYRSITGNRHVLKLCFGWRPLLTACHLPSFPTFQRQLTTGNTVEFCKESGPVCATGTTHLGPLLGKLPKRGYCREMKIISIRFDVTEQDGLSDLLRTFLLHASRNT